MVLYGMATSSRLAIQGRKNFTIGIQKVKRVFSTYTLYPHASVSADLEIYAHTLHFLRQDTPTLQ